MVCFKSVITRGFKTRLNQFIKATLPALVLLSCGTGVDSSVRWQFEGLQETHIHEIINTDNEALAIAAGVGIFIYENDSFERTGFKGEDILDIVFIDKNKMIAAIRNVEMNAQTLFKTTNGGSSWQPHMGNYGGEKGFTYISELAIHPNNKNILFARGYGNVSRSFDGGQTWESVYLTWEHFVGSTSLLKINPYRPDVIWAGGANAVGQPNLFKSADNGDSWQSLEPPLENIESSVTSMVIHPSKSNSLLIGMASGHISGSIIRKSTDGGQSWHTVKDSIHTRTIVQSILDPEIVYASGINPSGTVFFVKSNDFGNSWEEITFEDSPAGVRVNDMISVKEDGREVLYFGTNKGVFSYRFED